MKGNSMKKKIVLSMNSSETTRHLYAKKQILDTDLTLFIKINSKRTVDLNINYKTCR